MSEKGNSSLAMKDYDMTDDEMKEFFYLDPVKESLSKDDPTNEIMLDNEYEFHDINNVLEIPDYLSSKNNKIFENMLQEKNVFDSASSINLEELKQITILMHQLNVLDFEKSLWNHYLQSGTGTIKSHESSLHIWPLHVKKIIQLAKRPTTVSDIDQIKVAHDDCLIFVHQYQCELDKKQQQLQQKLNQKKKQFYGYTNTLDAILQMFVQDHIQCLNLKYQYKIKLGEFHYREQILESTFAEQNPNEAQKQLKKRLSDTKYDYEKAKQEIAHQKLSQTINSIQIPLPTSIQSIMNTNLRQQMSDRHENILKNYKNEMKAIFTDILENKLQDSQKIFDNEMAQMWQDQRKLPANERLNPAMINFIDQYLSLITEKVQCIYHYKTFSIPSTS